MRIAGHWRDTVRVQASVMSRRPSFVVALHPNCVTGLVDVHNQ